MVCDFHIINRLLYKMGMIMYRFDNNLNPSVVSARLCGFLSLPDAGLEKALNRRHSIHLSQRQITGAFDGCDLCFEDGIPHTVYSALKQIVFDENGREMLSVISDYAFINKVSAGIRMAYRISSNAEDETVLLRLTPIRFLFRPKFILYVSTVDLYTYH